MLTGFPQTKPLSSRARSKMDLFLNTLISEYRFPKKVTSKKIETGLKITGPEVRAMVHELREKGHLILSDSGGYSYTTDPKDAHTTLKHISERIRSLSRVRSSLETAMRKAGSGTSQMELL